MKRRHDDTVEEGQSLADFEAHTRGFGSKLMHKMGYQAVSAHRYPKLIIVFQGGGLGARGDGISAPITDSVVQHVGRRGIGVGSINRNTRLRGAFPRVQW